MSTEREPTNGVLENLRIDFRECWQKLPNKGFSLLLLAAWLALFQFLGNSTLGYVHSPSLFRFVLDTCNPQLVYWLTALDFHSVFHWMGQAEEGHIIVVPLVVLGLFWWKRKELMALPLALWAPGLWVLARQGSQPASAHRIVALALVSPFTVAMVQSAWVEVYLVAGVVWWMALCHHRRAWSVVALAIALLVNAITLVVLVPAFLWSRRARVEIVIAAGIAVIVALPFALVTGVGAFVYDVIGIQLAPPACRRVTRGATGTVSR